MRGWLGLLAFALIVAAIGFGVVRWLEVNRPQDLPWTPLDLRQPIGWSTGVKLARLTDDAPRCRALLRAARVRFVTLPPTGEGACRVPDGMRLGGARYWPGELETACPVAAALAVWDREVVAPAATRHFGQDVRMIVHLGSRSCRRMYARPDAPWSEHATADAIDIAGFRLADGRRVTVLDDWYRDTPDAAFLREVRDGACRLFATTLSPDYNAAHRDHLHLDQAARGKRGFGACR